VLDIPMTKAERRRLRREHRRERQRNALVPVTGITPAIPIEKPAEALKSVRPIAVQDIGRCIIGISLICLAFALVYASVRANAWAGFALSADENAGEIFATLTVTAELIAFLMPTANHLYRQMGELWSAAKGWFIVIVASSIVAFAASGFILTSVSDKTASRSQASPAVEVAKRALVDAKAARDRECIKVVGTYCRHREDIVVARQRALDEAMAHAVDRADPQAFALGVNPSSLRLVQAGVLVVMCLLAGFVLSHGWGLVFRR
jgi:hypothetical protein